MEAAAQNKLFITEIINNLHREGFVRGGKAETMLHDWSAELRKDARVHFPASRIKKFHSEHVGAQNW